MGFALSDMQLTSSAFAFGGAIPARHTGEGDDISPALAWSNAPEGTRGFALVCHDPDAPLIRLETYGFVHWVAYNIPGSATGLDEGQTDYTAGRNDFDKHGYGGPMPPPGHGPHHYFFTLFALDRELDIEAGLNMWHLFARIEPHVLGMNRLVGVYERK